MVDLLEARAPASAVADAMRHQDVRAPVLLDPEVYAAIRRDVRRGRVAANEAYRLFFALRRLLITRHRVDDALGDALALRERFGGHGVFYALLARRLGATLVTTDGRLARAATGFCDVRHLAPADT